MAWDDAEGFFQQIPSFIFKNRKLSALEALVHYLKEYQNMTYAQIARLINRDDRTVWTTYDRAKKKLGEKKQDAGTMKRTEQASMRRGK